MWVCCYQNCATLHNRINCKCKSFAFMHSQICRDDANATSDIFCDMYACIKKKIMTVIFNFIEDLFLHFFEVLTIKSFTISVRDYLFYSCDLNVWLGGETVRGFRS